MLDSNGNKIPEKTAAEDYDFTVAEIKFMMKGFQNCPDVARAVAVAGVIKKMLDNQKIFAQIEFEDRECIEISVEKLEDYSYHSEDSDLLWEMVYLRRRLVKAYSYIDMKHFAAESKFISALHFDRICTVAPTAYNYGARYCEYANTVRYVQSEPEVQDKWNTERVKKLFARAENFVESKKLLSDDQYLEYAGYYYDTKRFYYQRNSDIFAEYQAAKREMYYLWERYCLLKSTEVLKEVIKKYINFTEYEKYSFYAEKQRFEELLELAKAWAAEENSLNVGGYYHQLLNRYRYFTD